MTTADDHVLARDLAEEAGRRLLELRADASAKGDPDALRKAGDLGSHDFLLARLHEARPGDMVLSEEGADDPARLTAGRVWIVDPLDGTREFGEAGRTDWAVHVALWERASGLTAGAVALPAQGKVLSTLTTVVKNRLGENSADCRPENSPQGADLPPSRPAAVGPNHEMSDLRAEGAGAGGSWGDGGDREVGGGQGTGLGKIVVSRSRAPRFLRDVAKRVGAEVSTLGSAGAKIAAVIMGDFDAYLHAGGFYEWDTAAPVAVARTTGLHTSRLDGSELRYNQADLLLPDILVCHPAHAGVLLEAIREVTHAS
jgi:3'(2'), 5'-bisphosphate nucleotidase